MPVNTLTKDVADKADKTIVDTEKNVHDFAQRAEQLVQDGLERLRVQSRTYADNAEHSLETAQKYVVERVHERPLTITFAALGVGVLFGLLMSGGRRR